MNCLLAVRPQASVAVAVALPVASSGTANETENVPPEDTVVDLDPVTAPLSVTVTLLPGVKPWPLTVMLVDAATVAGGWVRTGDVAGHGLTVGVGDGGGGGGLGDAGGLVGVGLEAGEVGVERGVEPGVGEVRGVEVGVDPALGD